MEAAAMDITALNGTARAMVAEGKGILAADESSGTIERRFRAIGVTSTEEARRDWRQLLFTAPGASQYISGVILYDETLRQRTSDGTPLVQVLTGQGIIPGIKVDAGAVPLAGSPGETVTEGLDGLRKRLEEYRGLGARFTKWRAVIAIGAGPDGRTLPTPYCIGVNAHALARYAALAQEAGLVPIVEPEVLMDGPHDLQRCYEATETTLRRVFHELADQGVDLEGIVLKPNMVVAGTGSGRRATPAEVAEATVRCFRHTVPAAVPGIAFLSGGQGDEEATANLNAINRIPGLPWEVTFSYGRGLQSTPMAVWAGNTANVAKAQQSFLKRAQMTAAAREGRYTPELERAAA
jgi:fructose-bisphosphate aldolase class I